MRRPFVNKIVRRRFDVLGMCGMSIILGLTVDMLVLIEVSASRGLRRYCKFIETENILFI